MAYSNSPLVTYTNLNRGGHSTGRTASSIQLITIHCYVAQVTAKQGCDAFAGRTDASCNYVVGRDGTIGLCVEEKNRSWCSGGSLSVNGITGGQNDQSAVTIEVASDTTSPWAITDQAYTSLVALVADIAKRNGISELKWRADKSLVGRPDLQNMTVHRWFANKACPGDYIYERLGKIADEANALLGNPTRYAQLVATLPKGSGGQVGTPYTPRLECPETGNPYYNQKSSGGYSTCILGSPTISGLNTLRNCVGYALGRFNEIGNYGCFKYSISGNAAQFIANKGSLSSGSTPKLGAIIVWSGGSKGAGHVGIVEKINSDGSIVTSESGWGASSTFWTKQRAAGGNWGAGSAYHFLGFVYNPAVTDDAYVVGDIGYGGGGGIPSRPATFADIGIDTSKIAPFIVAVDQDTTKIDYAKLKDLKVSGMLFFAGQKYDDATHLPRSVFRAKNLRKQVEDCNENGMQFALYTKVMAQSEEEAREELTQLYYTVSRYPPGLGIWLSLKFKANQSKSLNGKILDVYYEKLSKWGLMQGAGLYVTRDELETIEWDDYKEKFLLWLIDYCSSESECADICNISDTIPSQKFFQTDPNAVYDVSYSLLPDGTMSSTLTPSSPLGDQTFQKIKAEAEKYLGVPYVWGGYSPSGFDCSGFVSYVLNHSGWNFGRKGAEALRQYCTEVSKSDAKPGDLIFFKNTYAAPNPNGATHVGIYTGNGQMIHAGKPVQYTSIEGQYYQQHFMCFGRLPAA